MSEAQDAVSEKILHLISTLNVEINARFDKMDQRFDRVDDRFERIEKKVDELAEAVMHNTVSINQNSRDIATQTSRVNDLSQNVHATNKILDSCFSESVTEEYRPTLNVH